MAKLSKRIRAFREKVDPEKAYPFDEALLGEGWEGEVYHVVETATGIERAAKLFYPQRNPRNKQLKFYAKKLNKLSDCPILIRYFTQDTCVFDGEKVTFLVSEYAPGELVSDYLKEQRGKRLHPFEAMHLLHALVRGLEDIHAHGEYHGDLHPDNVLVERKGLGFRLKLLDLYNWGRRTSEHVLDDVCGAIKIFYDATGGQQHYAKQPPEVKAICCGLKRGLIKKKFPTAKRLRLYLETMEWE